jgi:hypothetical protein
MRPHQSAQTPRTCRGCRYVQMAASVLIVCAASLASPPRALADDTAEDLRQLRATVEKELADLKQREQKLHQEFLRLDQKSQLLDEQLHKLRAAGTGPGNTNSSTAAGDAAPPVRAGNSPEPASATVAQTTPDQPAPEGGSATPTTPPVDESAPISGPSAKERETRQVVEAAPVLSSVGGVLTPKGQIVIDPSIEYDYWSQNQLGVNGFQVIPGITFGNIFATRFDQNISTAAVTIRGGVTDRLELNIKIPYVYNAGSTSSFFRSMQVAQAWAMSSSARATSSIPARAVVRFLLGICCLKQLPVSTRSRFRSSRQTTRTASFWQVPRRRSRREPDSIRSRPA